MTKDKVYFVDNTSGKIIETWIERGDQKTLRKYIHLYTFGRTPKYVLGFFIICTVGTYFFFLIKHLLKYL